MGLKLILLARILTLNSDAAPSYTLLLIFKLLKYFLSRFESISLSIQEKKRKIRFPIGIFLVSFIYKQGFANDRNPFARTRLLGVGEH